MSYDLRVGLTLSLVLGLVVLFAGVPATAQDQACDHVISLPGTQTVGYVISEPGIYCLATDVIMAASFSLATDHAIEIAAKYVTLDLNGHKVHGAAAGTATQAVGIHAFNRQNVTVKNGTVWGFGQGVFLDASDLLSPAGNVVDRVRVQNNRLHGIRVLGVNNIVRNNVVANTGPSTLPGDHDANGILVGGDGNRILNNDILTVTPTGAGVGTGILAVSNVNVLVVGNRITTAAHGITAGGKCRDNLTADVPVLTRFSCVADAGGND